MKLTAASTLAAEWDMDEAELKRRVRRYGWPVVKLSRTDWRFTEQQVEQIVAMQSSAPKPREKSPAKTGQSKASRKRTA
ncbi:MAG TPA: hypothetical protein VJ782_08725 [Aeromicrobium sp.]|nr:hypothetical protein [Aeromicrobium sp.]